MAWAAAERVLRQQAQLHARLRDLLASYPPSGLYDDEVADAAAFGAFVAHVRHALTSSARTVLLRDLDARFAALPSAQELCEILDLSVDAPIARVAAALGRADGGRAYRQWEAAAALASKPVLAREAHIRAIGEGMAAKAKRRGDPPPRDAEIVAAVDAAIAAANAARASAAARADELWTIALADDDHARWARARHLWDDGGGRALWSSYQSLSVSDGDERRERGGAFEEGHAELSFRIAVLRIEALTGRPRGDFSYVRAATWRDGRGRHVGEIDLVVLYRPRVSGGDGDGGCDGDVDGNDDGGTNSAGVVCAIIEMKAGCLEIAAAMRQHESKLAAALAPRAAGAPPAYTIHAGSEWRAPALRLLVPTIGSAPGPDSPNEVAVFVATMVPAHAYAIGAEPMLLKAVCAAIRDPEGSAEGSAETGCSEQLARIERSVREAMGPALGESALGCLERRAERVIVVGAAGIECAEGEGSGDGARTVVPLAQTRSRDGLNRIRGELVLG